AASAASAAMGRLSSAWLVTARGPFPDPPHTAPRVAAESRYRGTCTPIPVMPMTDPLIVVSGAPRPLGVSSGTRRLRPDRRGRPREGHADGALARRCAAGVGGLLHDEAVARTGD